MKINIEINTEEETTEEALSFLHGKDYKRVVQDIDAELRRITKYDNAISEETHLAFDSLRDFLRESIADNVSTDLL